MNRKTIRCDLLAAAAKSCCDSHSHTPLLDRAISEIAGGSKLGIDAAKKLPGEGFKRPWTPLIKMDGAQARD